MSLMRFCGLHCSIYDRCFTGWAAFENMMAVVPSSSYQMSRLSHLTPYEVCENRPIAISEDKHKPSGVFSHPPRTNLDQSEYLLAPLYGKKHAC